MTGRPGSDEPCPRPDVLQGGVDYGTVEEVGSVGAARHIRGAGADHGGPVAGQPRPAAYVGPGTGVAAHKTFGGHICASGTLISSTRLITLVVCDSW